jgi:hypothetical protein
MLSPRFQANLKRRHHTDAVKAQQHYSNVDLYSHLSPDPHRKLHSSDAANSEVGLQQQLQQLVCSS